MLAGGNADAGVAHLDPEHAARLKADRGGHFTPGGKLDGVAGQIENDLPEPGRIGHHLLGDIGVDFADQFDALFVSADGYGTQGLLQQLVDTERHRIDLQPPGFDLGKVQNVVDDSE